MTVHDILFSPWLAELTIKSYLFSIITLLVTPCLIYAGNWRLFGTHLSSWLALRIGAIITIWFGDITMLVPIALILTITSITGVYQTIRIINHRRARKQNQ